MGSFRYRKSVRLAPGVKLNFNKKSVSLTGGVRGAHVTKSFGGRSNYSVGAPGTGLWYRGYLGGKHRRAAQGESLGYQLATAPEGTTKAKIGNFFVWLGGLVWLLPLAAIVAAIFGGLHNFGGFYIVLALIWTVWMARRSFKRRERHRQAVAAAAAASAPPPPVEFTPAEQQLRTYWRSLIEDGLLTQSDEASLDAKIEELQIPDEAGINDLHGRFADLIWLSKIGKANAGELPALESPTLMTKPGEVVHLEGPANLMKRHTYQGITTYETDEDGTFSITSKRFVFIGESHTLDISYRRLNAVTFYYDPDPVGEASLHSAIVVHAGQKSSCLWLGLGNADLAAAVIHAAAKRDSGS